LIGQADGTIGYEVAEPSVISLQGYLAALVGNFYLKLAGYRAKTAARAKTTMII
jgi:hypothetical protein